MAYPISLLKGFFSLLHRELKLKVDKKTTHEDINKTIKTNRSKLMKLYKEDGRLHSMVRLWREKKGFSDAFKNSLQRGSYRAGKKSIIYTEKWRPEETEWLYQRRGMPGKKLISSYCERFPDSFRTDKSITTKKYRMR